MILVKGTFFSFALEIARAETFEDQFNVFSKFLSCFREDMNVININDDK